MRQMWLYQWAECCLRQNWMIGATITILHAYKCSRYNYISVKFHGFPFFFSLDFTTQNAQTEHKIQVQKRRRKTVEPLFADVWCSRRSLSLFRFYSHLWRPLFMGLWCIQNCMPFRTLYFGAQFLRIIRHIANETKL